MRDLLEQGQALGGSDIGQGKNRSSPDVFVRMIEILEHFAFGGGRHFCLGAMLAKSQLEVAANMLMDRFPDMRLAEGFTPTWKGIKMRSVDKLLVTL